MFSKILHANDGSEHAFHAFDPRACDRQDKMTPNFTWFRVEEIDYMPEFVEEVARRREPPPGVSTAFSSAPARWRRKAM